LRTKEVLLADDNDSEYCGTKHRDLHSTQEEPDHIVDPPHLLEGGAIGALNWLLNPLILIFTTEVPLPIDLEDLVPHEYERENGRDAACSREQCSRVGGEFVRCGDHVDVVLRALAQRRERPSGDRAREATCDVGIVVERADVGGDWDAIVVVRAIRRLDAEELDYQAQQAFKERFSHKQSVRETTKTAAHQQE
jgi:hypothetical protein